MRRKLLVNHTPNIQDAKIREIIAGEPAEISAGGTRFYALPRSLWRDANGCGCEYCAPARGAAGPRRRAYWDTLAVTVEDRRIDAVPVHGPEFQPLP